MKKTLLLMWAFVMSIVAGFAQTATFDFTNPTGLTPPVTPAEAASSGVNVEDQTFTNNNVSISWAGIEGTTTNGTKVWTGTKSYDLRVYKNQTMTITAPKAITSITFPGSDVKDASMAV